VRLNAAKVLESTVVGNIASVTPQSLTFLVIIMMF